MSMQRRGHAATLLDSGEVLLVGGYLWTDANGSAHRIERYDPATGVWTTFGDSPGYHAFESHGVRLADGRVLVLSLESAEIYDPATDTWANLPANSGAFISNSSVTQLTDGDVLVAGATMDTSNWSDAVRLDGTTLQVQASSNLHLARGAHSATLLADGRVLVAGGRRFVDEIENFEVLAHAEIYDPSSNTWLVAAPMLEPRVDHQAALLADGRVLVSGGSGLASTELYDPLADAWMPGPAMSAVRGGHSLTVLPSGWLVAVGGNGPSGVLASAEAFDPASNTWSPLPALAQARMDHTATYVPGHGLLVTGGSTSHTNFLAGLASAELHALGTLVEGDACVMPDECTSGLCDSELCVEEDGPKPGPGPGKGKGKGKGKGNNQADATLEGCAFDSEAPFEQAPLLLGPVLLACRRRARE